MRPVQPGTALVSLSHSHGSHFLVHICGNGGDPSQKIKLKTFHAEIINDHELLKTETASYRELPVITDVNVLMVGKNFKRIKKE
jgi:hypothetical protein